MCKTFSCWPVLLFYMHIVLSLVRCRNPDNVHCFGTVFMNEISLCIPLLCTPVPLQSENREVAQLSFDTVGPAQLIPMGSNQTRRCNWIREMTWNLYTRRVRGRMNAKQHGFKMTFYSGADQIKHQSSASLAFVRGIHRWPVNSPHKGPVMRKMFPFDDVIMVGK